MFKPIHEIIRCNPSDEYVASEWTGEAVEPAQPSGLATVKAKTETRKPAKPVFGKRGS